MLNNLSNGSSWLETTDTWESTLTWASYSDRVSLTNVSVGSLAGLWVQAVNPWLLSLPWQYVAIWQSDKVNNLSNGASWLESTDTWESARTWASYSDRATLTNL